MHKACIEVDGLENTGFAKPPTGNNGRAYCFGLVCGWVCESAERTKRKQITMTRLCACLKVSARKIGLLMTLFILCSYLASLNYHIMITCQ